MSTQGLTHANWSAADSAEFHAAYDSALRAATNEATSRQWPIHVAGNWHHDRPVFSHTSPGDRSVALGSATCANEGDVDAAVAAARAAYPSWRGLAVSDRLTLVRRLADLIDANRYRVAAYLSLEIGKNRYESITEVQEAVELLRFYADAAESEDGFVTHYPPLGNEESVSVLRPYGVWAILGPFNFPFALTAGMSAAALIMGNTVVIKTPDLTPIAGVLLMELVESADFPVGVVNLLAGGAEVGKELTANPEIAGAGFTGSMEVGQAIRRTLDGRPVVAEMGGKNAAIVMSSADLDVAAEAIARSAFRYSGQKCSACSRVFVHNRLTDQLAEAVAAQAAAMTRGTPWDKETVVGPLINQAAGERIAAAFDAAARDARSFTVTEVPEELVDLGAYSGLGVAVDLPMGHGLLRQELFAPLVVFQSVSSVEEAITATNDTPFGLTAGLYTSDRGEIEVFLDRIEAGVVYVNRSSGATTGAWVGHQSFGGWKGSGSTGANAHGAYYLHQFAREQSRTVVAP